MGRGPLPEPRSWQVIVYYISSSQCRYGFNQVKPTHPKISIKQLKGPRQ